MTTLSPRQKNILQFIISFFNENKFPPTIREIGETVGISSTSVVNYNLAKLEEEQLVTRRREVSRGLSLNWERLTELGFGRGRTEEVEVEPPPPTRGESLFSNMIQIPVLGRIAAGSPIQVEPRESTNPEDWVPIAEGLLGSSQNLFALRVQGNSMIDASVLDGDIVILRHQETAHDGDMVAAWIEGDEETTLKYFYHEGKNVRLQPANPNPEYQPIIRPANRVRINGKVVSVIRVMHN